ncbi:MAG: hypothetical protein ACK5AZ_13730 [Bryobacteraceae bacterium]
MSTLRIELNRIRLTLHGVSPAVAEAAVAGLDAELRLRLADAPWSTARPISIDVPSVSVRAVAPVGDAAALRAVIADQLAEQILRSYEERS